MVDTHHQTQPVPVIIPIIIHITCRSQKEIDETAKLVTPIPNTLVLTVSDAEWVTTPASISSFSAPEEQTLFLSPPYQRLLTRSEEAVASLTEIMRRIETARAERDGRLMILIGCTPFQMLRTVSFWCVCGKLTKEWAAMRNTLTAICDGLRQSQHHMYMEGDSVKSHIPLLSRFSSVLLRLKMTKVEQIAASAAAASASASVTEVNHEDECVETTLTTRNVLLPFFIGVFAFSAGLYFRHRK